MKETTRTITLAPNVYQDAYGITAKASRRINGERTWIKERYPLGTPLGEIQAWQETAAVQLTTLARRDQVTRGTLADDRAVYLKTAAITPATAIRRNQQLTWLCNQPGDDGKPLGDRRRYTLAGAELQRVFKRLKGKPSTFNKYRQAAHHLWTVLDGKAAPNPMKDVPERREADALPRNIDYRIVRLILQHATSKYGKPSARGKDTARLAVLAYCPVTPAQMRLIEPATDLDLDSATPSIMVRGRRKGSGVKPRRKPLVPLGVAALRSALRFPDVFTFNTRNLSRTFARAKRGAQAELRKADPTASLAGIQMKDIRHSFAQLIFDATNGDQAAVAKMLDHTRLSTTDRYTLGSVPAHLQRASAAAAAILANLGELPQAPAPAAPAHARPAALRRVK